MRCSSGAGLTGRPKRPAQRSIQARHLAQLALRRGLGPSGQLHGRPWAALALRCSAGLGLQCWAPRSVAALPIASGGPPTPPKPSPHPCQLGLGCLGPEAADSGRCRAPARPLPPPLLRARHQLLLRCRPAQSLRGRLHRRHRPPLCQRRRQRPRHRGRQSPKALSRLNSRAPCPKWRLTGRRKWHQMLFTEKQRA